MDCLKRDRLEGDPARLVASSEKVFHELGWKAKYSLEEIIQSAWKWHQDETFKKQTLHP